MSIKLKFEKFCSFSATHFIDSLRNYGSRHLHLLEEEEGGGGRLFFTQFGSPSLLILPNCCNCHGVIIKLFFSFSEWEKGQKNFLFFFLLSTHPKRIPSQLGRGGGPFFFYNLKKKRKFFQTPTKQSGTKERNADTMKSSRPPFSSLTYCFLTFFFFHFSIEYHLLSFSSSLTHYCLFVCVCVCVVPPSDIMSASGAPYGMHVGLFLFAAILHSFLKNKKKKKDLFIFRQKKKRFFRMCRLEETREI